MNRKENQRIVFQSDKPSGGGEWLKKIRKLRSGEDVEQEINELAGEYAEQIVLGEMDLNTALIDAMSSMWWAGVLEGKSKDE